MRVLKMILQAPAGLVVAVRSAFLGLRAAAEKEIQELKPIAVAMLALAAVVNAVQGDWGNAAIEAVAAVAVAA